MRQSTAYDNRYCTGCACTTRHEVQEQIYACLRCGGVKYPSNMKEMLRVTALPSIPVMPMATQMPMMPKTVCA